LIRLDGSPPQPLFPTEALTGFSAYANDGRLAYWYNAPLAFFRSIAVDGTPFLTDVQHDFTRPAWSPDGREMVVARDSVPARFERVDMATRQRTTLFVADSGVVLASPVFSPDGSLLAYARVQLTTSEIWICNRDGSGARRLTAGFLDDSPAFSPDGTEVAFARHAGLSGALHIVKADGSQEARLVDGFGYSPSWIP
jgi:Tol biopolymer transport system component